MKRKRKTRLLLNIMTKLTKLQSLVRHCGIMDFTKFSHMLLQYERRVIKAC